jgi:hypothetical protein
MIDTHVQCYEFYDRGSTYPSRCVQLLGHPGKCYFYNKYTNKNGNIVKRKVYFSKKVVNNDIT